eukprot:scaffold15977_cov123-Isochrysis_galbana.AAC.3
MAPRRPGTQPTEADLTLDIGAKRARVEGEDESSTQVRLRARTRACTSLPAQALRTHLPGCCAGCLCAEEVRFHKGM